MGCVAIHNPCNFCLLRLSDYRYYLLLNNSHHTIIDMTTCFTLALSSTRRFHTAPQISPIRQRTRTTATADPAARSRVNINKYKSQRALIATERSTLEPKEINDLFIRAGRNPRDEGKWLNAIENTFLIVTSRLISNRRLVGFARATSDHALNGTIWDVVTDPALPEENAMRRKVVVFLLKELRRTVPGCSIALFSSVDDREFYENLDFVADPDGIKGMVRVLDGDFNY